MSGKVAAMVRASGCGDGDWRGAKKASLGTWEGGRPLFNRRGYRTRNLLGGRRLPSFAFALAARA